MLHAARLVAPDADDILAKARSGDEVAVAHLIRAHQGMVFSLAVHVLGNRATAEDVAQDVFLDMFRHLKAIESAAHLVFWLRRVTSHRCIDRMRRDPHRAEVPGDGRPRARVASRLARGVPRGSRETDGQAIAAAPADGGHARYQEDLDPSDIAAVAERADQHR